MITEVRKCAFCRKPFLWQFSHKSQRFCSKLCGRRKRDGVIVGAKGTAFSVLPNQRIVAEVKRMYADGWGKNIIAQRLGIASSTARRILRRAGLWDTSKTQVRHLYVRPKLVADADALILAQYSRERRYWNKPCHTWAAHPAIANYKFIVRYRGDPVFRELVKDKARRAWHSTRKWNIWDRARKKARIDDLSDGYVRAKLGYKLSDNVPAIVIEIARLRLQLKRATANPFKAFVSP